MKTSTVIERALKSGPKTFGEIAKGKDHLRSRLSAALHTMLKRGLVQTSGAKGAYTYALAAVTPAAARPAAPKSAEPPPSSTFPAAITVDNRLVLVHPDKPATVLDQAQTDAIADVVLANFEAE